MGLERLADAKLFNWPVGNLLLDVLDGPLERLRNLVGISAPQAMSSALDDNDFVLDPLSLEFGSHFATLFNGNVFVRRPMQEQRRWEIGRHVANGAERRDFVAVQFRV